MITLTYIAQVLGIVLGVVGVVIWLGQEAGR